MNAGGPAFPQITTLPPSEREGRDHPEVISSGGMSLRDWFAGHALAGALASDAVQSVIGEAARRRNIPVAETWAANAYQLADAMLAERAKKTS